MKLCEHHAGPGRLTPRTIVALILTTLALSSACYSELKSTAQDEPVFRAPFVLKLHVDKKHYYEEAFDRVPYVADNDMYLFAGKTFGINVTITKGQLSGIAYQRDPTKADVALAFTQKTSANGPMMMLATRNRLKRSLSFDALKWLPGFEMGRLQGSGSEIGLA